VSSSIYLPLNLHVFLLFWVTTWFYSTYFGVQNCSALTCRLFFNGSCIFHVSHH
jgi:hypothetical protein